MTIALRKPAAEPAALVAILVEAFADDAAVRMLYPDDRDYRRHFPEFVLAFGGGAFGAGTADRSPGGEGAALWYPPGVEPDGEAIMACLEASVPADRLDRMGAGMELQASLHPHAPHWYLPWIGVRPDARGRGIGSDLLRRGLARADAEGLPVYLEATGPQSAALYARFGFEALGRVVSPGYPEIIGMWRPAAPG